MRPGGNSLPPSGLTLRPRSFGTCKRGGGAAFLALAALRKGCECMCASTPGLAAAAPSWRLGSGPAATRQMEAHGWRGAVTPPPQARLDPATHTQDYY